MTNAFLADISTALEKQRSMAEKALAQVDDPGFFEPLDPASNSLASLVQHMAGSTRSRFTDFLTSDGEKPDRHRDREFETRGDDRQELMEAWDDSWNLMLQTIRGLSEADLSTSITIRSEPHTVQAALLRALTHQAYHVGQIVQLARYRCADRWQTLSIAKGQSEAFTQQMRKKFEAQKFEKT